MSSTVEVKRGKKRESVSRTEFYGRDSLICSTPPIDGLHDISAHWQNLGKYESTGYGMNPLRWSEVRDYADLHDLPLWQSDIIHMMSRIFVFSYYETKDKKAAPPYLANDLPFAHLAAMAASELMMKEQAP